MAEIPSTDALLIAQIRSPSNQAAWEEFVQLYGPVIRRMARRRGLQEADGSDVAQQVFVSVSRSIEHWEGGDHRPPFRAWLSTIVRNAITKVLATQSRVQGAGSTSAVCLLNQETAKPTTDAEIQLEARRQIVLQMCERIRNEFSVLTWNAFWRTAVRGESIADVSAETGQSAGAIYVARHRIIRRLRDCVSSANRRWSPASIDADD